MNSIIVEPSVLEATASKMEESTQQYKTDFNQLFQQVEAMKSAWEGKDNIAFTNQIHGFEDDLQQIEVLCLQYVEYLRSCARAYTSTQEELSLQASKLSN